MLISAGVICSNCGAECLREGPSSCGAAGYAETTDGARICYYCAAERERADMIETGRAILYVEREVFHRDCEGEFVRYWVTNWPGSLRFRAIHMRTGGHNIAGTVHTLHFIGPDGFRWSARSWGGRFAGGLYCRARRLRERAPFPDLGRPGVDSQSELISPGCTRLRRPAA